MDTPKKTARGGRREGAGRPVGTTKERPAPPDLPPIGPLIAERVAQARAEREAAQGAPISLRDLAAATGVSVPTLQEILAGRGDPKASALRGIAAALRVRVGWLIGE